MIRNPRSYKINQLKIIDEKTHGQRDFESRYFNTLTLLSVLHSFTDPRKIVLEPSRANFLSLGVLSEQKKKKKGKKEKSERRISEYDETRELKATARISHR